MALIKTRHLHQFLVMDDFPRIKRLPHYVFNIVGELKAAARARGEDIIDFGMGNPDQPTPQPIVDKLCEAAQRGNTHRYSVSRGVPRLRRAICNWYGERYNVDIDPESEAIVTIGSKEGLAHLASDIDFFEELETALKNMFPKPKILVLNFPGNPTAQCVELDFFERIVDMAIEHKFWVVQDLAYADIVFDGYKAPSIMQVPGAKDVAVESFSLSKSYNMPGWRVGFLVGNSKLISALARMKSYLDYGMFTPIQIASIFALEAPEAKQWVGDIRDMYQRRRDVLCDGLIAAGWPVEKPKATMFVWAKIPERFAELGSMEFSKILLSEAKVAVSPGIGFGDYGDQYVRFSLIENEHRTRQAIRNIKSMLLHPERIKV